MSLIAVCWNLNWIIGKSDELFRSLSEFELLGVEGLPTKIEIYSHSISIALLRSRKGEITSSTHFTSIGDFSL